MNRRYDRSLSEILSMHCDRQAREAEREADRWTGVALTIIALLIYFEVLI